jgi:hypothetical protein
MNKIVKNDNVKTMEQRLDQAERVSAYVGGVGILNQTVGLLKLPGNFTKLKSESLDTSSLTVKGESVMDKLLLKNGARSTDLDVAKFLLELESDVDAAQVTATGAETTAAQAVTTASDAAVSASASKEAADLAQTTAVEAVTNADLAKTAADEAVTKAAAAQDLVLTVQASVTAVVTNVATATATADSADEKAVAADEKADAAATAADAAATAADAAATAAATAKGATDAADAKAGDAQGAADAADAKAGDAQTAADTAAGVAATASTVALAAQGTAGTATTLVNTIKSEVDAAKDSISKLELEHVVPKVPMHGVNTTLGLARAVLDMTKSGEGTDSALVHRGWIKPRPKGVNFTMAAEPAAASAFNSSGDEDKIWKEWINGCAVTRVFDVLKDLNTEGIVTSQYTAARKQKTNTDGTTTAAVEGKAVNFLTGQDKEAIFNDMPVGALAQSENHLPGRLVHIDTLTENKRNTTGLARQEQALNWHENSNDLLGITVIMGNPSTMGTTGEDPRQFHNSMAPAFDSTAKKRQLLIFGQDMVLTPQASAGAAGKFVIPLASTGDATTVATHKAGKFDPVRTHVAFKTNQFGDKPTEIKGVDYAATAAAGIVHNAIVIGVPKAAAPVAAATGVTAISDAQRQEAAQVIIAKGSFIYLESIEASGDASWKANVDGTSGDGDNKMTGKVAVLAYLDLSKSKIDPTALSVGMEYLATVNA